MRTLFANPKTTLLGIFMIVAALAHAGISYLNTQTIDSTLLIGGITAGAGLIAAKDASTHSTPAEVNRAGLDANFKAAK